MPLTKAKRFDGSSSQPIAVIRSEGGLIADPLGVGPTPFPLFPGAVSTFSGITFCPSFFSPREVAGSLFSGGLWIFEDSFLVSSPLVRAGSWEGGSGITGWLKAEEFTDAGGPDFGGELASGGVGSTGWLEAEELTDAGGPGFGEGLASGGAGLTGCFWAGGVTDTGELGFGGELASGRAGLTGCFGAEDVMDAGGPDFDGKPNHTTTA
jgi:hypothetical protein